MTRLYHKTENDLTLLDSIDDYRRHFMDIDFWRRYVEAICVRHKLTEAPVIRTGLAGSYPTFIINDTWVIKLFGRLFEGAMSFETELQVNPLVTAAPGIPAPALLAKGQLFPDSSNWPWPYLIYEFVPGISIGEVYEQVSFAGKLAAAQWMGQISRQLHDLPTEALSTEIHTAYQRLILYQYENCADIHRRSAILPEALIEQLPAYLLPLDDLLDYAPCLIHADFTADHLLGELSNHRWMNGYIIDFDDAMVGDIAYELVALHLDLFRADKRLLAAYLDAHGLDQAARQSLPKRAMSVTLLHRFDVLEGRYKQFLRTNEVKTLEQLASLLWDIDTPGLDVLST